MTPIGELRLSIPVALTTYHLNWFTSYAISVLGNLVPVLFFLLFLKPLSSWLSGKFSFFDEFFSWLFERTRKRHKDKIKKYGYPALVLVVAIPLPVTGGWTGTLVAFLSGIEFKKAFPLISLGVLIAGGIVTVLTETGVAIEQYFGYEALAGVIIIGVLLWFLYNRIRSNNE